MPDLSSPPLQEEVNTEKSLADLADSTSETLLRMALGKLFRERLSIPDYQRSYSWRTTHVEDLLKDICGHQSPYLMGTVILHQFQEGQFDIVDGQQRLVTLTILLYTLQCHSCLLPLLSEEFSEGAAVDIRKTKDTIQSFLLSKSAEEKKQLLALLTADTIDDNKPHLQFHVLVLNKIPNGPDPLDRAYTFFDSVNSKGKALSDFDLLKAHHLMFIPSKQEVLATHHNADWLSKDEAHADLFSKTLRRLRMWAGNRERDNKKEWADFNEFSSVVEPDHEEDMVHVFNRYMQPAAFHSWRREGDRIVLSMDYPVQDGELLIPTEITQTIEGGDAFFLYAKRYHSLYNALFRFTEKDRPPTAFLFAQKLGISIANAYLQDAFRAVILLYTDKFRDDRLVETSVCIERILSALRWRADRIRIEGVLTHVHKKGIVPILLDSVNSRHAFTQLLRVAQSVDQGPENDVAERSVRARYRNALQGFYLNERYKITDLHVQSLIARLLPSSTSESS